MYKHNYCTEKKILFSSFVKLLFIIVNMTQQNTMQSVMGTNCAFLPTSESYTSIQTLFSQDVSTKRLKKTIPENDTSITKSEANSQHPSISFFNPFEQTDGQNFGESQVFSDQIHCSSSPNEECDLLCSEVDLSSDHSGGQPPLHDAEDNPVSSCSSSHKKTGISAFTIFLTIEDLFYNRMSEEDKNERVRKWISDLQPH